ncbi:MAG: N-acetyltransferase family protein [Candidatus Thorarchaeota archaeon]|jgi:ribosomal-protein-alanine N-acetyltransferase
MEEQSIKVKDGREVTLRLLLSDDKEQLLDMFTNMSEEALMWSNPPYDEDKINRWMSGVGTGLSLVAVFESRIIGVSAVYQFPRPREKGLGGMMIYILQDFHGVGLGTAMTENLLTLAKNKGLHRIGLEVVEDNEAAVRLYKKLGFEIEGVLKDAYYGSDGKYHNLFAMGILFSEA